MKLLQNPHVLLTYGKVHNPLRLPCETTSERPKVARDRQFLTLLTSKCASRRNGVHFFDISISKSAPNFSSLIWPDGFASAALANLLFDLSEPQIIGKNTLIRNFSTFSRTCIFFLLTLSSDSFSSLLFSDLLSSFFFLLSSFFLPLRFASLLFASLLFSSLL